VDMSLQEIPNSHFLETLQAEGLARQVENEAGQFIALKPDSAACLAELLKQAGLVGLNVAMHPQDCLWMKSPVCLDLSGLNHIRRHWVEDFMIEVESGITMGELSAVLAEFDQAVALNYPESVTLFEVLSEELAAFESGFRGLPRDWVLKLEVATPDGTVSVSGADVVKNATGYELAKLHVGAYGAFGIITAVTLKLISKPSDKRQCLYTIPHLTDAIAWVEQLWQRAYPFSVLTLRSSAEGWHVFMELSGASAVLDYAEQYLPACPSFITEQRSSEDIRDAFEIPWHQRDTTLLELTVPVSCWPGVLLLLSTQTALQQSVVQACPNAGLVYIMAPTVSYATLSFLNKEARQLSGFLTVRQLSVQDGVLLGNQVHGLAGINLPEDPVVLALLQNLKSCFDAHRVLFTPRMPV
jgi:hypothetical protein